MTEPTTVVEFVAREACDVWEPLLIQADPPTTLARLMRLMLVVESLAYRRHNIEIHVGSEGFVIRFDALDDEDAEQIIAELTGMLGPLAHRDFCVRKG